MKLFTLFCFSIFFVVTGLSQNHSVAREWNNLILEGIRNDYARPTVHARNLFHHSIITYDAWAAYENSNDTYLLGKTINGFTCPFNDINIPLDIKESREEAISFASYQFIQNRYSNSPDYAATLALIQSYMISKGYDINNTSTDYLNGGPAELGNYLAEQIQLFGYTDGSNEINDYGNQFYTQSNPPIIMSQPGNPNIQDPNRWQPITLATSIDQSGNPVLDTPSNLSPEWGEVLPFSLDTSMYTELIQDGDVYKVYFDTLSPAFLTVGDSSSWDSFYKWNHTLVSVWQSHLDPNDGVNWDISPASIGNNTWYPDTEADYPAFYDLINGGDPSTGYALNPITGLPYTPQIVPRADYARVLAEFWADGIDSETPPGHWFEIYHYITDQPSFERKWQGVGPVLDTLEFDVKSHLTLGGTMHDAAICAWSLKGYYDYIRPVSAIRYMADQGQSSDTTASNYNPNGIPLLNGFVELVTIGDPLAGTWDENVGKIKLFTWKGHEYISDPLTEVAGVDWILAENFWTYQRPTFVTPPFSGFVSGHSTFSRAASKTMEYITGSPFFPGGLGEWQAIQDQYLQFEDGPSQTITLQWATYKDAADQCSLSRIWGGIHPPIDDIPGRKIGEVVGELAFNEANELFNIENPALLASQTSDSLINTSDLLGQFFMDFEFNVAMDTSISPIINLFPLELNSSIGVNNIQWIDSFNVNVAFDVLLNYAELDYTNVKLSNLFSGSNQQLSDYSFIDHFEVDTNLPAVESIITNTAVINDAYLTQDLIITIEFDEPCNQLIAPTIDFSGLNYTNITLSNNAILSGWQNDSIFESHFSALDFNEEVDNILIEISLAKDIHENEMNIENSSASFIIDTKQPSINSALSSDNYISQLDLQSPSFQLTIEFDEEMNTSILPVLSFQNQGIPFDSIIQNINQTNWLDSITLTSEFSIFNSNNDLLELDLLTVGANDVNGNHLIDSINLSVINHDMKPPSVLQTIYSHAVISDSVIGSNLFYVDVQFSEPMDTTVNPLIFFTSPELLTGTIQYNVPLSEYVDSTNFRAYYQIIDENIEIDSISIEVQYGKDFIGNTQVQYSLPNVIEVDTKNPNIIGVYSNEYSLNYFGQPFDIVILFDEPMFSAIAPNLNFNPSISTLTSLITIDSFWVNPVSFQYNFDFQGSTATSEVYGLTISTAYDEAGNQVSPSINSDYLTISEVLNLIDLDEEQVALYPTLLKSGTPLNLIGINNTTSEDIKFSVVNMMGQVKETLTFEKSSKGYSSGPLNLNPGMYFVRNNNMYFNIIITE